MRVLIFSMTCGEGHNSVSKSVEMAFRERYGQDVEFFHLQTYGFDPARVEKENKKLLFALKYIRPFYAMAWSALRKRNPNKTSRAFLGSVKECGDYFLEQVKDINPDIIICTHYYASTVLSELKRKGLLDEKYLTCSILTDYSIHPYWEFSRGVDFVFTPRKENLSEFKGRLFKEEQIVCTGMPVKMEATQQLDNSALRKKFGFDKFTVLLAGGGFGLGKTLKTVKNILKTNPDVQIVVANGRNKKTFGQIERLIKDRNLDNITNLSFVNNMIEYIAASDVIVTQGGALSLTEALCQHKPIIIRENMVNNEELNKQIFIENGCALGMKRLGDAGKLVEKLKKSPQLCKEMGQSCANFAKPNAAKDLVDFLVKKYEERKEQ